jgi:predicted permease
MPGRRAVSIATTLYAFALRHAPEAVRDYAADMRATFEARARAAHGGRALIALFVRELADLIRARLSARSFSMRSVARLLPTFPQFRQAVRSLRRRPAFAIAAVATLSLGTAATTTIFAIVDTVLLRPLPYPDAGRLVTVHESSSSAKSKTSLIAPGRLEDWNRMSRAFDGIAGYYSESVTDTSVPDPERLQGLRVTPRFFAVFGAAPIAGRTFSDAEERFNGPGAAVISEGFWTRRFQRDPAAVGRRLTVGGSAFTIVGVMPATFGDAATDVWLPAQLPPGLMTVREARFLNGIGRMKAGVSIGQASDDLAGVQASLARQFPRTDANWTAELRALQAARVGDSGRTLWLVFAAVALLWLIGAANMAGLMLVELKRRGREIAIRAAIGGSSGQIAGVVLHEVFIIAVTGGTLGAAAAAWLVTLVPAAFTTMPRLAELHFEGRAAAFALASTAAAAVIFGLWPALAMSRTKAPGLARAMGSGVRASTGRHALQKTLVVAQTALGFLLVGAAALIGRTYLNLARVDVGFDASNVVTFQVGARWDEDRVRVGQFQEGLIRGLQAMPGVSAAGFVNFLPLGGATLRYQVTVSGVTGPEKNGAMTVGARMMSADYPRVMRARLLAGEWCPALKTDFQSPAHVLVNRAFVETFAPSQSLAGRDLRILQNPNAAFIISGVTENMIEDGPQASAAPYVYSCDSAGSWPDPQYVVRTDDAAGFGRALRGLVKSLDPGRAVFGLKPLERVAAAALDQPRLNAAILGGFALAALLLAALGLYGLFTLVVSEGTREIGVRLALGAEPARIVSEVCMSAGRLLVAGIAGGLVLTAGAQTLLRTALFGVSTLDPVTLAVTTIVLCAVSGVAIAVPAARAARVDPLIAMRAD